VIVMDKPERTFRMGSVSASVFVNRAKSGRSFRSVSLQRRYKEGDKWKTASNYTQSDIPAAVAVLQLAMHHIAGGDAPKSDSK
jgi:hypothetical protein